MKEKYEFLIIPLLLLFIADLSLCQDGSYSQANSVGITENPSLSTSSAMIGKANATPTATVANISISTAEPQNLRYIWTITGIENGQVTMALDQDGQDLFGQAKYEPDGGEPWNGNVAGFIKGNEVHLFITAVEGDKQVTAALEGIFDNDAISGGFFRMSEGKISDRGTFNAVWINPDLTSYTPAEIKEPKAEIEALVTNASATASAYTNQMPPQKTIYHDVHQDADRVLTGVGDISQIPIGMGGSGLP